MNESTRAYPFLRGQFVCSGDKGCGELFYAEREVVDIEDGVYFAKCPACGCDSVETSYMQNLHKTIGTAKGANMSAEGRAKSRLNGFTTGSSANLPWYKGKIPMAPAKPGKYAECDECQDLNECKYQVEYRFDTCIPVYCHRKMEVTLKYAAAFLSGDPESLKLMAASNAAKMQMLFNASVKKVFERGVELIEKEYKWSKDGKICNDPDGNPYEVEKIFAHPLIKRCIEIAQVMGFTLGDWTMTPKSKEAKEQVSGFLAGLGAGSGVTAEKITSDIKGAVENFTSMLRQAQDLRQNDKTLKTFEAESGKREGSD